MRLGAKGPSSVVRPIGISLATLQIGCPFSVPHSHAIARENNVCKDTQENSLRSRLVYVGDGTECEWSHRRAHIEQRSQRKGETEQNILAEWADEAYLDESAVTFDPDYASDTGLSARTIGWSDSAGLLITVITVRDENDHLWGATAFRANSTDERHYLGL